MSCHSLSESAQQLANALAARGKRLVLAESCTGGLASATLAMMPGISQWYCGSAVTYREQTKIQWLGLTPSAIEQHNVVSDFVAREMAQGVLLNTVEADLSGAITGHLGPDAPEELDGVVYIAVARRDSGGSLPVDGWRLQLVAGSRSQRQSEAAALLMRSICGALGG